MKVFISCASTYIIPNVISKTPTDAVHFGDFDIGRDTVRSRMNAGRSTGHFGTGIYFMSMPKKKVMLMKVDL